jgi:protein TonB
VKVQPAKARANLASYITDDDYPQDAIRNEQQGTTGFRLDVGPDGRVTNCTVTSSSGSSALDNTTCRLLRSRARFTPATDSSGGKTSDSVTGRIRWQLPED